MRSSKSYRPYIRPRAPSARLALVDIIPSGLPLETSLEQIALIRDSRIGCEQRQLRQAVAVQQAGNRDTPVHTLAAMTKQKSLTKVGLAGGIAGSMEIAVTYPLEYVKTNVQLQHGAAGTGPATMELSIASANDKNKWLEGPLQRLRAVVRVRRAPVGRALRCL